MARKRKPYKKIKRNRKVRRVPIKVDKVLPTKIGQLKLTERVIKKTVKLLRQGNYISVVCQAIGITYLTYNNWIKRGQDYDIIITDWLECKQDGREIPTDLKRMINLCNGIKAIKNNLYYRFFKAVQSTSAMAEIEIVEDMRPQVKEDWKCGLAMLERGPGKDRWAKKSTVDVQKKVDISIDSTKYQDRSVEELEALQLKLKEKNDPVIDAEFKKVRKKRKPIV